MNLARLVNAKPDETRRLVLSFLCFFCLLSGYYMLRPLRDAMGVDRGIEQVPWYFLATFLTICVAVPLYSAVVARFPRHRVMTIAYRFFAANLVGFFVWFLLAPKHTLLGPVFFVWTSVYNMFIVSVFWSVMADVWTTEQGKRLFGAIAAGGSVGAIAGPSLTTLLAGGFGVEPLPLITAALLELSALCARGVGLAESRVAVGGSVFAGVSHLVRSRFLLGIGALIFLYAMTSSVLYGMRAQYVAGAAADLVRRTVLFGKLDAAGNTLTLLLQLFLTSRIIQSAGLVVALSLTAVATTVGLLVLGVVPTVAVLVVFEATRRALHFAVDRPSREVLFTFVPAEEKYKAKSFLDTFVYRGADVAGIWTYAGLAAVAPGLGGTSLLAVPLALVWIVAAIAMGRAAEKGTTS